MRSQIICALALTVALTAGTALAADKPHLTLYKDPQCSCCEGHAEDLRAHGYAVRIVPSQDLSLIQRARGVPPDLAGCHTIVAGDYVVEGHVPAPVIDRLLRERPRIKGISLPGMPEGSPGMPGVKREPFVIYEIGSDLKVFAVE